MPGKPVPCPICKTLSPPEAPTHPFCSERCRLIDLGQWLGGKYVVPGEATKPTSEDETDD
jgi:endogenous inhibitor of DNA gyrase (YacG/DUF329 family)